MRISAWSSDVCSSDLPPARMAHIDQHARPDIGLEVAIGRRSPVIGIMQRRVAMRARVQRREHAADIHRTAVADHRMAVQCEGRSEEHTSELQSLMRISYAVFCLKKKNNTNRKQII